MTRVPIENVGSIGIVQSTDAPSHSLPPGAWTSGQNIRFQDNKVVKFTGHKAVFDPPNIAPSWAIAIPTSTAMYWIYTSLTKASVYEGGVHADITRASGNYNANVTDVWNGGILGGIPIINNSIDIPQFWASASPTTKLADLTNWPVGMTAKVIKPFKAFLVALNVTKNVGLNEYPHMVKWSHPADPGSIPVTWDETDATKDAGEVDLTDVSAGIIRDGLALRDMFVIYKDGSTWGMRFLGGRFIFKLFNIFTTSGILAQDCVAALPKGKGHFVLTGDDLIIHDGQKIQSIVDRKWRKYLATNIDTNNFDKSFCVTNYAEREMWACFPTSGNTTPNIALTWSLIDGSIGVRDLSNISYIAQGEVNNTDIAASWNADLNSWDSDTTAWGGQLYTAFIRRMLACDPSTTKLYQFDTTNQLAGVNMASSITREGHPWLDVDSNGKPRANFGQRKIVTRIWPRMTGGPVNIRVGTQETPQGTITWSNSASFLPGTDEYIDPEPTPSGRLIAVEFSTTTDVAWQLEGYDLMIEPIGQLV